MDLDAGSLVDIIVEAYENSLLIASIFSEKQEAWFLLEKLEEWKRKWARRPGDTLVSP